MRRGGRMIYAFDVTNPGTPSLLWKVGCPNLGNDDGCTAGMSGIGQTWSTAR
jgi:type IV pilus assembly protein PilY1